MTLKNNQKGSSAVFFVLFLLFFVMVAKGALSVVPIYLENATIKSIVEDFIVDQEDKKLARSEILVALDKRFVVNGIDSVDSSAFTLEREGSGLILSLAYSVTVPYMMNIDIVVNFDTESFDVTDIAAI